MSYADIKTKTVEEVISEEHFYTLKESILQSYLFIDEPSKQEVKELLLYAFIIKEEELIERSSSFHKHKSERVILPSAIETAEQWMEKSNIKKIYPHYLN
ncbi:hypothetical protein [Siminovitchia terrae]|uniref:hypothetical protein n=1 Tax=Siminovitchia terrae TaxID=1914933 RepID=UPI001BB3317C|nr:hypothetical protein [Siminovitchia terrae]